MKRITLFSILLIGLSLIALPLLAQTSSGYDLSWSSVDSGGTANIQSGAYTWSSSVGQPDAGTLSEGAYAFQGGFWGGVFTPVDYQSVQSGDWSTGGTWGETNAPAYNAIVTIRAGDTITVSGAAQCYNLTVEHGAMLVIEEGATLAVGNRVVNAGTLRQMQLVDGSALVSFLALSDYRGVDLNTDNDLGSVTVTVQALDIGEYCTTDGATSPPYARRCFRIQPTNNLSATVRLWALASGINFSGAPAVFHNPGGTSIWTELADNASTGTSGDYVYAEADTSGFSYFLLAESGQAPTRVAARAFFAHSGTLIGLLALGFGTLLFALVYKRK